jgi:hypothetical protein
MVDIAVGEKVSHPTANIILESSHQLRNMVLG